MSTHQLSSPTAGLIVYEGHTSYVTSVAFSPDGKSLVSGSVDSTIRLWDSNTSSPRGKPWKRHTTAIYSVSYSPVDDMVASGSGDRTIRLWDTASGHQVGEPLRGHTNEVRSVAFSPDAELIASGSRDSTIRLWDVQTRKPVYGPLKGHTDWVSSVAFSPDGTRLVSGSVDKELRVWDVVNARMVLAPLSGHTHHVASVSFSPDGSQIVSGSFDKTLRLWDARSGNKIGKPYQGHDNYVISVAFSPNGIYLASGSYDGTTRVWDVRTGRQVDEPFTQHADAVTAVAFSPCGKRIASGSDDYTVTIWSPFDDNLEAEHDYHAKSVDRSESAAAEIDFFKAEKQQPELEGSIDKIYQHMSIHDSFEAEAEQRETEGTTDEINHHMSVQEMLGLLSCHGCVDLQKTSQIEPDQPSAILLSGGGFGDIWRGVLLDGTKVAIKAWRGSVIEQCDYKLLKRATREIHYWSKMRHKNVHELMGVVVFRGQSLGMVSEWMENGNLHEYLRKNPEANRLQLSVQVASGVAYVHRCNMIHGDIKALNVLVSADGTAKLTDFGLSTMSESSLEFSATTSAQAGSAPELLLEEGTKSKASDIYALGMTILEIFTGKMPYAETRRDIIISRMIEKGVHPTRPTTEIKDSESDNQVWKLLVSCWNMEPDARPLGDAVTRTLVSISLLEGV